MAKTYEPIATTTLGSAQSTITFSSIPSTYTDLVITLVAKADSSADQVKLNFNSDTGTNYALTALQGSGTSASPSAYANGSFIDITRSDNLNTTNAFTKIDIFNYAGSTFKTCLVSWNHDINGSGYVTNSVGMWRSTSAITSFTFTLGVSFAVGSTATLYGIKAA